MKLSDTKNDILDAAQNIIQLRGYNGFSFADISETVGIRKASIHHHFSSKAALGVAVIRRYRAAFNDLLDEANSKGPTWIEKIHHYVNIYKSVLEENKLCLCGILASDVETLPKPLKKEIRGFFDDNAAWLANVINTQFKSMTDKRVHEIAWHIISSLQGAVILARMQEEIEIFSSTWKTLSLYLKNIK